MGKKNRQSRARPSSVPASAGVRTASWWPWIAIGCLAVAIRLFYLWQIHATDLVTVLMGDAGGYDAWATRIAAGNWLGDRVFYQAPLYPYFLGLLFSLGGHHLDMVRIVQCLMGGASCVFLARAGEQFFSRSVGIVAGFLLALNPTAIFFDCLIQKAVLDSFCFTLVLMVTGRLTRRSEMTWTWPALGAALGCLTLTRENALILFPLMIFWAGRLGTWRKAAAVAIGAACVLLPVAFRNLAVGGEFHLTTAQIGPNFYIGNHGGADGTYQPLKTRRGDPMFEETDARELAERNLGRKLSPREVSDYWLSKSFEYITGHPGQWGKLMWRKWFLTWNAIELGDTEEQAAYEEFSSGLWFLSRFLHFGIVLPLAVMGFVWTWPERRRLWILYATALVYALSVAVFYVFSRYRFPLVSLSILFAAGGIVDGRRFLRQVRGRTVWAGLAAGCCAAVFANWPAMGRSTEGAVTFSNLGSRMTKMGEFERAVPYFRRALEKAPNFDEAQYGLGAALWNLGQSDEALEHFQAAATLDPANADAQYNVGVVLQKKFGRLDEAIERYRETLRLDPSRADASNNLANILSGKGNTAEAIELLQHAAEVAPAYAPTYLNLGTVLFGAGRVDEAVKSFERCVQIQPDLWEAHFNLGRVKALQGDAAGAVSSLSQAEKFMPAGSPQLATVRSLLAEQLGKLGPQR